MEYILYIFRFIYRIRWWALIGTSLLTTAAILMTMNMGKNYEVQATLYTGIVSGYTIEGGGGGVDWVASQNAMDNLINIIKAESTLKRVSYRLYARCLIHGDPEKDNDYITADNYRQMYNHVKNSAQGKEILSLIDKDSEDKTVENLIKYERPERSNYIYGLFYFNHIHYSYEALRKIQVSRKGNSDLLDISYSNNDAGITYNTINILMEEFVNEYRAVRYGETDKVIEYFKSELGRVGSILRIHEDSLTTYSIEKRIINYTDETKEIASINKEFELREQDATIEYNGSRVMLEELEKHMDSNVKSLINNIDFINKIKEASTLTGKISELETFADDKKGELSIDNYKDRLNQTKKELLSITDRYVEHQFSKEGMTKNNIIEQWMEQVLKFEKAKSDLQIIDKSRQDLSEKYIFYAPVGSTLRRQERQITFTEQNYLTILASYNTALMRKKSLEMTSATIKVLNPPAYPISPGPTARKEIVAAACAGSLLFILGFFLLLEILDRTLRDTVRTQRLTKSKVLGAFPDGNSPKMRKHYNACAPIASKYLSSSILRFFDKRKGQPYIVNFLSIEPSEGKSYITKAVESYWRGIGLKVRKLTWEKDFNVNSRDFLLAKSVADIYTAGDEDILIVEYPSLNANNISNELLQEAQLNLLVTRADRGWKEADKIILEKVKKQSENIPLYLYLNYAEREVVEEFTGMLPPYTFIHQQMYRLSQLGLTERTVKLASSKAKDEDEDE